MFSTATEIRRHAYYDAILDLYLLRIIDRAMRDRLLRELCSD